MKLRKKTYLINAERSYSLRHKQQKLPIINLNSISVRKSVDSNATHANSIKMTRMKLYENARRMHKASSILRLPSLGYKRYTNPVLDSSILKLIKISGNVSRSVEQKKRTYPKTQRKEIPLDSKKYSYLRGAKGFRISDLQISKEDSFLKTTLPQSKIVTLLGAFQGIFTRNSIMESYPEALFILEQQYADLKKTLMMNEVLLLAVGVLDMEELPQQISLINNIVTTLCKGLFDILRGKIRMVYPLKFMKKFSNAILSLSEKELLHNSTCFDSLLLYSGKIMDLENIDPEYKLNITDTFLKIMWSALSDINFQISKRDEEDGNSDHLSKMALADFSIANTVLYSILRFLEERDEFISSGFASQLSRLLYVLYSICDAGWKTSYDVLSVNVLHGILDLFGMTFILLGSESAVQMILGDTSEEDLSTCAKNILESFIEYIKMPGEPTHLFEIYERKVFRILDHIPPLYSTQSLLGLETQELILNEFGKMVHRIVHAYRLGEIRLILSEFLESLLECISRIVESTPGYRHKEKLFKIARPYFGDVLSVLNFAKVSKDVENRIQIINSKIVRLLTEMEREVQKRPFTHKV